MEGTGRIQTSESKIDSVLFNKDFAFEHIDGIDGIRSIESTNRIYGIYMILLESGLLYAHKGILNVSEKAAIYLGLKLEDKCRYLLEHYLKSHGIYELDRIVESSYRAELKGNMTECRKIIIKHLKNCPIGEWIPIAQFLDYIKILDKHFLTDQVKYITYLSDKYRVYLEYIYAYRDTWEEYDELKKKEIYE